MNCGGCTACCRATPSLILHPEMGDDPTAYVTTPDGKRLAPDGSGACRYVGPEGCTIYDKRPASCRLLDCRVLFRALTRQERRQKARVNPAYEAVFEAARNR